MQDDNCSLVYFLISRSYTCHVNADVLIRRADIIDVTPELSTDELIVELTTTTIHPPLMKEIDRQTLVDLTSQGSTLSVVFELLKEDKSFLGKLIVNTHIM